MRFSSIRTRIAVLTTLFSMLLVGGVTTATYFLVAQGMSNAAQNTSARFADMAQLVVTRTADNAALAGLNRGLRGIKADEYVAYLLLASAPESISQGLAYEGSFSLYVSDGADPELRHAWSVGPTAYVGSAADRQRAAETGKPIRRSTAHPPLLTGLFMKANLGQYITYMPVKIPGTTAAVLQAVYVPGREEAIMNATRLPMLTVAGLSLVMALLITAWTTSWTLRLVDQLRRAAESIDVGQLDVQLPEDGRNEVADLAHSLNRLIGNLRRRNEAQVRFMADASHELATPVAGIRGYVNILRAWGAEDPALREEAVSAIDRESRRMARLCGELLSVIRNEEVAQYRQVRYDINAVCREVLANAATRYFEKNLEFTGPEEGPLWLFGDPDRIEETLSILVDNACKYTPEGGSVSVTTRRHRSEVVVEIVDTGVGIPEEDLANIFDRFYRSDASRSSETGGFGLGLAIAKHIIDVSGGRVEVRSKLGEGTTFEVWLPRQKSSRA